MKHLLSFTAFALLAVFTIASCKKESTMRTTSASSFLTASSSTTPSLFSSDSVTVGGASGVKFEINTVSSTGATFNMEVDPYSGAVGTYTIGASTGIAYTSAGGGGTSVVAEYGTIILTAASPNIIGTFHFTGNDSVVYTGSFSFPAP